MLCAFVALCFLPLSLVIALPSTTLNATHGAECYGEHDGQHYGARLTKSLLMQFADPHADDDRVLLTTSISRADKTRSIGAIPFSFAMSDSGPEGERYTIIYGIAHINQYWARDDYTTGRELRQAANDIVEDCVNNDRNARFVLGGKSRVAITVEIMLGVLPFMASINDTGVGPESQGESGNSTYRIPGFQIA